MTPITRPKTIRDWILNEYTIQEIKDIHDHGIGVGFSGMTYYEDTVRFYDMYSEEIWELLLEDAENMGCTPIEIIAGFNNKNHIDTDTTFKNMLAWYAVENVVCKVWHEVEDETEENK